MENKNQIGNTKDQNRLYFKSILIFNNVVLVYFVSDTQEEAYQDSSEMNSFFFFDVHPLASFLLESFLHKEGRKKESKEGPKSFIGAVKERFT